MSTKNECKYEKLFDDIHHTIRYHFAENTRRYLYHLIHRKYNCNFCLENLKEIGQLVYLALAYERGINNNDKISIHSLIKSCEVLDVHF